MHGPVSGGRGGGGCVFSIPVDGGIVCGGRRKDYGTADGNQRAWGDGRNGCLCAGTLLLAGLARGKDAGGGTWAGAASGCPGADGGMHPVRVPLPDEDEPDRPHVFGWMARRHIYPGWKKEGQCTGTGGLSGYIKNGSVFALPFIVCSDGRTRFFELIVFQHNGEVCQIRVCFLLFIPVVNEESGKLLGSVFLAMLFERGQMLSQYTADR